MVENDAQTGLRLTATSKYCLKRAPPAAAIDHTAPSAEHIGSTEHANRKLLLFCAHRFVTRQELEKLALGHLVGTPLLRAYMHGFFVDNRLYRKAKVRTVLPF